MATEAPQVGSRQTFAKGEVIFHEGAIGDVAYVVEDGEVEIARTTSKSRKRRVLGIITRGGMFGEMALIDGAPRMADATALQPTTCMTIRRDLFERKLAAADPFLKGLIRIFVRNIRSMGDE
jgi:CRP/FNR family cyclic AMP-dependent transcriptional regulator